MEMITPMILGTGRSGHAIANSLAALAIRAPSLGLAPAQWLKRNESIAEAARRFPRALLCLATPHGLHAEQIQEADRAKVVGVLCEKPSCVNPDEVKALRSIQIPTAVFHVYRQTWGLQTLKKLIADGELGEIITIEGRYWQASTAERALKASGAAKTQSWKNEIRLAGAYDTYLDVGTHWLDAATFLIGSKIKTISGWRSYANAEAAHRDSHVQVALDYESGGRAFSSITKNSHGSTNHFEVNVFGKLGTAKWEFMSPDEIVLGKGRERRIVTRQTTDYGSHQPPFHGMGWLEGYIEIAEQFICELNGGAKGSYPSLPENLNLLEAMFATRWQN